MRAAKSKSATRARRQPSSTSSIPPSTVKKDPKYMKNPNPFTRSWFRAWLYKK